VRSALSKRKILTHTSLLYCRFDLLNSSTEQTAEGQHWAETSLQVVKVLTKHKLFDLYRRTTGLRRVAENTNKLEKCFINVAEFLCFYMFLLCQFTVNPACEIWGSYSSVHEDSNLLGCYAEWITSRFYGKANPALFRPQGLQCSERGGTALPLHECNCLSVDMASRSRRPCISLDRPRELQEFEAPRISKQVTYERGKVVSHSTGCLYPAYFWHPFVLETERIPGP